NHSALFHKDSLSSRSRGTVGSFRNHLRPDTAYIFFCNLVFQCSRYEDVTTLLQTLRRIPELIHCFPETKDTARIPAVFDHFVRIKSVRMIDGTVIFTNADDDGSEFHEHFRRVIAYITQSLYDHPLAGNTGC